MRTSGAGLSGQMQSQVYLTCSGDKVACVGPRVAGEVEVDKSAYGKEARLQESHLSEQKSDIRDHSGS